MLPVCAGVFLFGSSRARGAVAVAMGVLVGVAAIVAPAQSLEYVARALPGQALAEVHFPYQYSLTYVLGLFGVPPQVAVYAGNASYVTLALIAIPLGQNLSNKFNRPEMLAFIPAAAVVLGGPYMHMVDVCFAVPAALVLATDSRGRTRIAAAAAVCLLAVPWIVVSQLQQLFLLSVFVCAFTLWRLRIPLLPAATILAAITVALYSFQLHPAPFLAGRGPLYNSPDELAVTAWQVIVESTVAPVAPWLTIKIPTWLGVGTVLGLAWFMRGPIPGTEASA